jgi:hypothetical protein
MLCLLDVRLRRGDLARMAYMKSERKKGAVVLSRFRLEFAAARSPSRARGSQARHLPCTRSAPGPLQNLAELASVAKPRASMTTFSNYEQVNDRRQAEIIRSLGCEKPDLDHETAPAGLQELLRPGVIQALSDALAPAEFRDAVFATQAIQHNADFLLR